MGFVFLMVELLTGCTAGSPTHVQAEALVSSGNSSQPLAYPFPNSLSIPVRWIKPGSCLIGSPDSEETRLKHELQHEVQITEGFFIAETELSQRQRSAFMPNNPSKNAYPQCPVENMGWEEARTFCRMLTAQTQEADLK